jgi:hypothetical protein
LIPFVHTALGYLYSSVSLGLIHPDNARGVLAAGCLLGGMNDLCEYAYEVCRRSITVDTINAWVDFIETIPPRLDGAPTSDMPRTSVFGPYAQKLGENVFRYLVALPSALAVHQPPPAESSPPHDGREVLLQIYSHVPFEMFKAAVESPIFQIGKRRSILASFSLLSLRLTNHRYLSKGPTRLVSNLPRTLSNCESGELREVLALKRPSCLPLATLAGVLCISPAKCGNGLCGRSTPRCLISYLVHLFPNIASP